MRITVIRKIDDLGTVWIFEGTDATGKTVLFAVSHRPAREIEHGLLRFGPVEAEVPDYLFLTDAETR